MAGPGFGNAPGAFFSMTIMFSIKLNNGKVLELAPDARISLVLSNPAFDRDRIMRTFSFPFQVPLTPRNQAALRHAERFDTSNVWKEEQAEMWVGGAMHDRGELVTTGGNGEQIEAVFRNIPVTVMETLRKIYLNEIVDTITIPETGGGRNAFLQVQPPPLLYELNYGGNAYILGPTESTGMTQLEIAEYFRDAINADFAGVADVSIDSLVLDTDAINEHTPDWPAMTGFVITIYNSPGVVLQRSFLNYVEGTAATPVDEVCFPVVRWENFYDNKNSLFLRIMNPVWDGVAWENEYGTDEKAWESSFVPAMKLPYLLECIRNAAGLAFMSGWLADDADAAGLVWVSERSCDKVYKDWTEDAVFRWINGYEQTLDLKKHVPKMTGWDFLIRLANGLNLVIDYSEGGLYFRKAVDMVKDAPADWSDYMDAKRYNRTIKRPVGVRLYYSETEGEAFDDGGALDAYETLEGGDLIEMPFRTMYTTIFSYLGKNVPGSLRAPHTSRVGKCPAYGQDAASMPMHLVFVRGVKETSSTKEYLYATHDALDVNGSTVIGTLSLAPTGALGLVAVMWGDMIGYSDGYDFEGSAVLPENEVNRLRKWENTRVRFFHPNGSVRLVLRSVEVDVASRDASGWVQARVRGVMV